ncbi:MAG: NADH-quinone oxidoreductase subunit C [Candidatus Omnitrophota bacterium]|jgi:Ni,Fe-hydrogenase III large subunit/Ni,Fe-hydrogenase III component G
MDYKIILKELQEKYGLCPLSAVENCGDEVYFLVKEDDFKKTCVNIHKLLRSPVAAFFARDARAEKGVFIIYCVFESAKYKKWFFVSTEISENLAKFDSFAREIFSATLFEREIKEMFGIEPDGSPDTRRLHLHDEVWPRGYYPLRKDFKEIPAQANPPDEYVFNKVEGEGIFEVPVGPVHAGIIGPGHFRFSVAGEPIINLELRLGFTHRGIEKLFEGKNAFEAIEIAERVSGDSSFAHSLSFCQAIEKICHLSVPEEAKILRAILLELERMYNHVNGIGGIAIDVGFSFPSAYASLIKEAILRLNEEITASRYLKGVNGIGGVRLKIEKNKKTLILDSLRKIAKDFEEIKKILLSSSSFMDRVDGTGVLRKKTAEDFGVVGLAARASGVISDLRKDFPGIYTKVKFNLIKQESGDALARLNLRIFEFEESLRLIGEFIKILNYPKDEVLAKPLLKEGFASGCVEGWRGPVFYWLKLDNNGLIDRCKIVDPSFHNWQGLAYCVLGDIIPDFPLCNKSFDLSYSGNDL